MNITNASGIVGLQTKATPQSTNIFGTFQIGSNPERITFDDANVAYSLQGFFAGSSDVLSLNPSTGSTTGSTTWVAGAAQIETATAAGTVTGLGNASVTVTAAGMTGSPKTILVPVVNGDVASVWAGRVRAALAADTAVSALFNVTGTTTSIILTRKATVITSAGISTNIFPATDSTLNIALANGTSTGITAAPTSANTLAGTATDGVLIYDGDGKDFEGNTLGTLTRIDAALFKVVGGGVTISNGSNFVAALGTNGQQFLINPSISGSVGITATAPTSVQVTIFGKI
jgi:hypothetical protein